MKSYLVLILNHRNDSISSDSEKFDYYASWGKFLSKFTEDTLVGGSPLDKNAYALSCSGCVTEINRSGICAKGYLILKSNTIEALKHDLLDSPVFKNSDATFIIHEINFKALI